MIRGRRGPRIDGYSRLSGVEFGNNATNTSLHVGITADPVLYERVREPVAESIYDIQLRQRTKLLP